MFASKNFSKFKYLEINDLLKDIKESFNNFLFLKFENIIKEYFPIYDYSEKELRLDFKGLELGSPKITEDEAKYYGINFDIPLRFNFVLHNLVTGDAKEQKIFFGDIPAMTKSGTFIINGIERIIVNQLLRSPGIYFSYLMYGDAKKFGAKVMPHQGAWLEFQTEATDIIQVRIDRHKKVPVTILLKAFGFESNDEILNFFGNDNFIVNTLKKDNTLNREEALLEIHRKLKPFEPNTYDNALFYFENTFLNPARYNLSPIGRYHVNRRLNNDSQSPCLERRDIELIIKEIIRLNNDQNAERDDIDALYNRRVRDVAELLENQTRIGLLRLKKDIQDRMSAVDKSQALLPSQVVYPRKFINSIIEFFNISPLSQILDQVNPLSSIEHKRKLTGGGPGGLTKERATLEARDVHPSHYGRICPIQTPAEGQSVGISLSRALYARRNEYGFLETPYYKVVNGKISNEIVWLTADQEAKEIIASRFVNIDNKGNILDEEVEARVYGEPRLVSKDEVTLIDVSPFQIFSLATSLIPFVEHDDANRAQMGSKMQNQAVTLVKPDIPLVSTGLEEKTARESGLVIIAEHDGEVVYVDADCIILKCKTSKGYEKVVYNLRKFQRTSAFTCYNQKPIVRLGQKVKKGDVLTDGPAIKNGTLALGQNVLMAFLPWHGYNYEDAIIVSERLLKDDLFSSIYLEEFSVDVLDTRLGPEITTYDIPEVPENKLRNLDIDGYIQVGTYVKPGDILVGKITPKREVEITPEEKLLKAIFGEKAEEKKDSSLYLEPGKEGRVIKVKVLNRSKGEITEPGVLKRVFVEIAKLRKIQIGDKLANRHGNKGVISVILKEEDMPFLPDGRRLDIVLNTTGIISRMNIGQILEAHLGLAAHKLQYRAIVPPFSGFTADEVKAELRKANLPEDGKTILYDGLTGEPFNQRVTVGYMTIMKLVHMVEDKIHARSIGPYSLITQQPLGGRAQFGGQRLGEMEMWALAAHGATEILQEMLTIKSDDIVGRNLAYEQIIKGEKVEITYYSTIFEVLLNELKALGFNVEIQYYPKDKDKPTLPLGELGQTTEIPQEQHNE
ncbi:MAG: DNA-directed RNA polymerase subunit beta [Candidatus Parcubacteria bacterium]|nr:MAG: DNA-directed RNA polymerase subunit beta [Candidatus Parcubacteria bacterium]